MKSIAFLAASAALIAAGLSACNKDTTIAKDTEKPVISLSEPSVNDTLSMAVEDSVHIEFTATDNAELHEVAVNITNAAGTNVFTNSKDVDAKTYAFHAHFHPDSVTSITPFTLKVDASDHSGNETSQTVVFYVKP